MNFKIHIDSFKNNRVRNTWLLIVVLWFSLSSFAQIEGNDDFLAEIDLTLKERPSTFRELDSVFKTFKRDSLLMNELIQKSDELDYKAGKIYGINALGVIYRNISLYKKSIALHKEALMLADDIEYVEFKIVILNKLGVAYRRMDLVKPALDNHSKALDIARTVQEKNEVITKNIAVSQNSIGNIYLILEQYELAIRQFEKSLEIEKQKGNQLGLAINYQNIGFAHEAKGDFDKALKNFRLSLDYNNQIDSELGRVICYNSIGKVQIKQNKLSDAKLILENALEKALNLGDQFYIATSYINYGWALYKIGDIKEAEYYLKKGQSVAKAYSLNLIVVEAGKYLSDLYHNSGRHELAYQEYKDAVEREKTINNDRNLRYVNDVIIQYENEAKNRQITAMENKIEMFNMKFERNKMIFWYSILGLSVIGLSFFGIYRNRRLQQEKHILTLEQDMLRSQMNPHFIFNSLNSIKHYIINNEKQNAVYYLNKFSKLIRKILLASSEKESTLADELDTMQLYMNIENIRFSNEIDFKISVEESINTNGIKVPSLMLQPFLENALWHGLSSKKEDKKISLNVYKSSEDFVSILITDNGIGRVQAEKIKNEKLIKRKSLGIAITTARLANFSKSYTNDFKISIEDLYDDTHSAAGTSVKISIPIIKNSVLRTA
ncbi:MAG: tetratricopeptide repeat protein [Bacteroidota bacterium]